MIGVTTRSTSRSHGADVDTIAAALCGSMTGWRSARRCARDGPRVGIAPKLSDAELLTLAVLQVLGVATRTPAGCATPDP